MFSVEELYLNDKFNDYLLNISRLNRIPFDDFRQDLMVELLETGERFSGNEAKRLAKNLAQRSKRKKMMDDALSFIENIDSIDENESSVLWEDNHIL